MSLPPNCPSCGGTDHRRSSSSRCVNHKKRIREEGCDSLIHDIEVYAVKRCLASFICPTVDASLRTKILEAIRDDVKTISRLAIETSLLINLFYTFYLSKLDSDGFLNSFPRCNALGFTYRLKTKTTTKTMFPDPDSVMNLYWDMRNKYGVHNYDTKLRSFLIGNIMKQYETVLETNLKTHAFARIKRLITARMECDHSRDGKRLDKEEKKKIHEACYGRFYEKRVNAGYDVVDNFFDSLSVQLTADTITKNYWHHMHTFHAIRLELCKLGRKGFRLFPVFDYGVKHITYDTRALHELLRRVDPENVPGDWKILRERYPDLKALWNIYFDVPKKFGCSIQTDSVAVSVSMNRYIPKIKKNARETKKSKVSQAVLQQFGQHEILESLKSQQSPIIAVDPGAREPIVTCEASVVDGTLAYSFKRLTAGRVKFETGEMWRERKRIKWTTDVDNLFREDRERIENIYGDVATITAKDPRHVTSFVDFYLKWFTSKQSVYERRRMARLRFDKFTSHQKHYERVVKEFFDPVKKPLVIYGSGCRFMNTARVKGHRKYSHDSLLRALKRRGVDVKIVDEAYTTKTCSNCKSHGRICIADVSKSPHRYVHCPVCRKGFNRDRNGAKNILLDHLIKQISVRPSFVGRTMTDGHKVENRNPHSDSPV